MSSTRAGCKPWWWDTVSSCLALYLVPAPIVSTPEMLAIRLAVLTVTPDRVAKLPGQSQPPSLRTDPSTPYGCLAHPTLWLPFHLSSVAGPSLSCRDLPSPGKKVKEPTAMGPPLGGSSGAPQLLACFRPLALPPSLSDSLWWELILTKYAVPGAYPSTPGSPLSRKDTVPQEVWKVMPTSGCIWDLVSSLCSLMSSLHIRHLSDVTHTLGTLCQGLQSFQQRRQRSFLEELRDSLGGKVEAQASHQRGMRSSLDCKGARDPGVEGWST